jgi:GNAT superfamily N-acetyltransferase
MISLSFANAELSRMRSEVGASAVLWAGQDGVRVEPGRWVALSGARSINYNVILCHGASDGELLKASVDDISAAGVPGVIMVAGAGLGEVHHLAQQGWVCAGAAIFLIRDLEEAASLPQDPNVRKLEPAELPAARQIMADRFGLRDKLALVALPPDSAERPGQSVWGGFDERGEMVSCIAAVETDEYVSTWSFATSRAARGRGYGHRLMYTVFADAASHHRAALAHIPLHNEPIHRSFGYLELERWQIWSHPRWVFALLPKEASADGADR